MVAYSFQKQFAEPILAGTKRQTIRGNRARHAHVGEELQLYTGMRTKYCHLIGRRLCAAVHHIEIDFTGPFVKIRPNEESGLFVIIREARELDAFAQRDGFRSWSFLRAFWRKHHPGVERFEGVLVQWEALA